MYIYTFPFRTPKTLMKAKKQKSFRMMFGCVTGNFAHADHDDQDLPPPRPSSFKKKRNKNPYAARGLDKFSTVLAELEARREMILAKTESQGVALIRFMYDNSRDWVPIIVRPKAAKKLQAAEKAGISQEEHRVEKKAEGGKKAAAATTTTTMTMKSSSLKKRQEWWRWRDSYYWPLVMVMILLCLVVSGRMFAICCTCIWWYAMPSNVTKERSTMTKKKDYGRRLSDKRLLGGKKG